MPEPSAVISKLRETELKYRRLEELLSAPETFADIPLYTQTMKEYRTLAPVMTKYREYVSVSAEADDAAALSRLSLIHI